MFYQNTDKEWETFGKIDPYFGVLAQDKYQQANLTEMSKADFFKSGYDYLDNILRNVRKYITPDFVPRKAMDFGCGVGRLVIPLAEVAEHVVGVDVSDSMLREAKRNCSSRSLKNVSLLKSDDELSMIEDEYDFIHSYIVFQHIPVKRGERIFRNLLEHLAAGGVGVIHFTFATLNKVNRLIIWAKSYIPLVKNLTNLKHSITN